MYELAALFQSMAENRVFIFIIEIGITYRTTCEDTFSFTFFFSASAHSVPFLYSRFCERLNKTRGREKVRN